MDKILSKRKVGGFIAIVVLLFLFVVIGGVGFYYYNQYRIHNELIEKGQKASKEQNEYFEKGYLAYMQQNYDGALENFTNAEGLFGEELDYYRKNNQETVSNEDVVNKEDITEIKFSLSVVAAYNDFFNMAKSSKWVKIAKENLSKLEEVKHPSIEESKAIFKTLEESAELCAMYAKKEYEKAFLKLLDVENGALESDRDFFIFEVRFMIASAEALEEPLIMQKAQELLAIMAGKIFDDAGNPDGRITTLIRLANE